MRRAAFLAALILSACATAPVATNQATPVPAARIHTHEWLKPTEGCATLIVKRDTGFNAGGIAATLLLDGQPVADFWTGELLKLYPPPGEHILSVKVWSGATAETTANLTTVAPKVYRISFQSEGELQIQPTAF